MQYPIMQSNRKPLINAESYQSMYDYSISNPDEFWAEQADKFIDWEKKWERVSDVDFSKGKIVWFEGATLNVSYNCLDRHLPERADQVAIIWEGDDPNSSESITYKELHEKVCKFANGMKDLGVVKGDRICLYMPMIVEATVAMLACARLGAIHSVVFGGFSPDALRDRILDSECKLVITSDEGVRGGKSIPLKANVDIATKECGCVEHIVVVEKTGGEVTWGDRDVWYHELIENASTDFPCEMFDAETPLFILYTSGSTGKPKGVLHTSGGYLLYAAMTHKYTFDYQEGDIYWCTADVGWVTGHSYIVYGPLANGATTLMFEGIPN
ncbi:MAG: AMP-binding protein, partial [Gammaproteobacteria bacterium]|nr:AMP-binding protein [Gammaproteobacteria bacterium]